MKNNREEKEIWKKRKSKKEERMRVRKIKMEQKGGNNESF
jgi:hypothetical protein